MSGILNSREMAEILGQSQFNTMEDLLKVSDASLVEILKRLDADTVLIAARIASEELQQRILILVSSELADQWGPEINIPKAKSPWKKRVSHREPFYGPAPLWKSSRR